MEFVQQSQMLRKAANEYLKFLCSLSGLEYLLPDQDAPFDLLVNINGYKRIQTKTSVTKAPSGHYVFNVVRRHGSRVKRRVPYQEGEIDYFFLMDEEHNCWLIPFNEVKDYSSNLTPHNYPQYKIKLVGRVGVEPTTNAL